MKKIYCILTLLLVSCSTNQVYKKINIAVTRYNTSHDNKIELKRKWNPTKKIFKSLGKELGRSPKLIYIFSWSNGGIVEDNTNFTSLLYDVVNGKKYYIKNIDTKIHFTKDYQNFQIEEFLLKNYILGNIVFLFSLQNNFELSDSMGVNYHIVEIDNTEEVKVVLFESISLDANGDPF